MDWFLYDNDLRREKVKTFRNAKISSGTNHGSA